MLIFWLCSAIISSPVWENDVLTEAAFSILPGVVSGLVRKQKFYFHMQHGVYNTARSLTWHPLGKFYSALRLYVRLELHPRQSVCMSRETGMNTCARAYEYCLHRIRTLPTTCARLLTPLTIMLVFASFAEEVSAVAHLWWHFLGKVSEGARIVLLEVSIASSRHNDCGWQLVLVPIQTFC